MSSKFDKDKFHAIVAGTDSERKAFLSGSSISELFLKDPTSGRSMIPFDVPKALFEALFPGTTIMELEGMFSTTLDFGEDEVDALGFQYMLEWLIVCVTQGVYDNLDTKTADRENYIVDLRAAACALGFEKLVEVTTEAEGRNIKDVSKTVQQ